MVGGRNPLFWKQNERYQQVISQAPMPEEQEQEDEIEQPERKRGVLRTLMKLWRGR